MHSVGVRFTASVVYIEVCLKDWHVAMPKEGESYQWAVAKYGIRL